MTDEAHFMSASDYLNPAFISRPSDLTMEESLAAASAHAILYAGQEQNIANQIAMVTARNVFLTEDERTDKINEIRAWFGMDPKEEGIGVL